MQKPIQPSDAVALINQVKHNIYQFSDFAQDEFSILPQMPLNQISHFAKQIVNSGKAVAIQTNSHDSDVNEIVGTASFSIKSSHIILKSLDNKVAYLVAPKEIRHIRYI